MNFFSCFSGQHVSSNSSLLNNKKSLISDNTKEQGRSTQINLKEQGRTAQASLKEQGRSAQASLKAMNAAQKKAEQLGKLKLINLYGLNSDTIVTAIRFKY